MFIECSGQASQDPSAADHMSGTGASARAAASAHPTGTQQANMEVSCGFHRDMLELVSLGVNVSPLWHGQGGKGMKSSMVNELTARSRAGTASEVAGLHHVPPLPLAAAGFRDSPESRRAPRCCRHPQSRQGQSLAAHSPGVRALTLSRAWEIHKQGFLL